MEEKSFDRLLFIKRLIHLHGLTINEVIKMMGYKAPACFRHSFNVVQDIDLSRAEKFVNALGYDLDIKITGGNVNDEVVKLDYQKIESILAKRGEIYELSRLFFLQEAMARRGETYESVASKINRSSRSVAYYFKNDDIKLSSLYKIVWAMGSSIEFVITPKTQAPSTQNMRVARTTIQFIEDQNIEYIDPDESKLQLKMEKKIQSQQARSRKRSED